MNKPIINSINISDYFIDVVDEGGGTIDYKILPNTERLLVEKIFEQNQQLKRLQKENEELKARFNELYNNAEQLANKYNRCSGNKENELVEIINKTADEKNKYKQALEEIRELIQKCEIEDISCVQCKERKRCHCDLTRLLVEKIDEVLKNE